jgi:hypothetical protein
MAILALTQPFDDGSPRRGSERIISAWVMVLVVLLPYPLMAAETLDDSQSPRQTYNIELRWQHNDTPAGLSRSQYYRLTAAIPDVEVRLDTSGYLGQRARIFLALPQKIDGLDGSQGLRLSWETRGLFASGSTTPGNRALLFQGEVTDSTLVEFFNFTVHIDAGQITGRLQYRPIYEIERF